MNENDCDSNACSAVDNIRLWEERRNSNVCDVILKGTDNTPVPAHSSVLIAASSCIEELIDKNTAQCITFAIPDVGSWTLELALQFVYLRELNISHAELHDLRKAADLLKLDELTKKLDEFDGDQLNGYSMINEELNFTACNSLDDNTGPMVVEPDLDMAQVVSGETGLNKEVLGRLSEMTSSSGNREHSLVTVEYKCEDLEKGTKFTEISYIKVDGSSKTSHIQNVTDNKKRHRKVIAEIGKSSENIYQCGIGDCTKAFDSLDELRFHRHKRHKPADYQHECELCGRVFAFKANVKLHMERHLERVFHCSECEKSFHTRQDLAMHFRSHTGAKPFRCEFCDKCFSQSSNLMKHKRSVHNEEFAGGARPYECPECLKNFKTQDMLRKHMRRHEKRLTCALCHEKFRLRKELQKHTKEEHNVTNMPAAEEASLSVYKCDVCAKEFLELKRLQIHVESVHKETKRYSCSYPGCKYRSFYKYAIERHAAKHTNNELQLTCDNCGVKFASKKDRSQHVADKMCRESEIPDDKKLYACPVCEKPFYSVTSLLQHRKKDCKEDDDKLDLSEEITATNHFTEDISVPLKASHPSAVVSQNSIDNKCANIKVNVNIHEKSSDDCVVTVDHNQKTTDVSSQDFKHIPMTPVKKIQIQAFKCARCKKLFQRQTVIEKHQETCRMDDGTVPTVLPHTYHMMIVKSAS